MTAQGRAETHRFKKRFKEKTMYDVNDLIALDSELFIQVTCEAAAETVETASWGLAELDREYARSLAVVQEALAEACAIHVRATPVLAKMSRLSANPLRMVWEGLKTLV